MLSQQGAAALTSSVEAMLVNRYCTARINQCIVERASKKQKPKKRQIFQILPLKAFYQYRCISVENGQNNKASAGFFADFGLFEEKKEQRRRAVLVVVHSSVFAKSSVICFLNSKYYHGPTRGNHQ